MARYEYLPTVGGRVEPRPTAQIVSTDSNDGWVELGWLRESNSGVTISPATAKTYSSVWQALQIISGDVARVAFNRFDRTPTDDRKRNNRADGWAVLNQMANRFTHSYTLREVMTSHALLAGNGYALIVRNEFTGRVRGLLLLNPRHTRPIVRDDGELVYESDQLKKSIAAADVFHLKGLGDDAIEGTDVLTLARDSFGLGIAQERHGARTMKNGVSPKIVLTHPDMLTPEEGNELLDIFERKNSGVDNAGRPVLAAGGLGVTPLTISNDTAQWLESRQFQRQEVAAWFCLPPHKLGDMSRSAYNSVEAEERSYVSQTLMRWFVRWKIEAETKFLTEAEREAESYWEHNVDALIQGDFQTQTQTLRDLKDAKIITRNEARKKLNLPAVEGGDVFENSNTSSDKATDSNAPPAQPANVWDKTQRAAVRGLLHARALQLIKTEAGQVRNAVKGKAVGEAVENLYNALRPRFIEAIEQVLAVVRAAGWPSPTAEDIAAQHVDNSTQRLLAVLNDSTMPAETIPTAIAELVAAWPEQRAEEITTLVFGKADQ